MYILEIFQSKIVMKKSEHENQFIKPMSLESKIFKRFWNNISITVVNK